MTTPTLPQIVEALLFASPEPLTTSALVRAIRIAATTAVAGETAAEEEEVEAGESAATTAIAENASVVPEDTGDDDWVDDEVDEPAETSDASAEEMDNGNDPRAEPEPEGLTAAALVKISDVEVLAALAALSASYAADGRAFTLAERASGWRIFTLAEYGPWVRGLFPERRPHRLSQPALETLAIIAYRQPITKAAVEAVRGVSIDGPIQKLLDQNIIRIAGRADLPGRPLLYETTDFFFEHFGIRSVDDLPNASELRRVALPTPESEKPTEPEAVQPELPITPLGTAAVGDVVVDVVDDVVDDVVGVADVVDAVDVGDVADVADVADVGDVADVADVADVVDVVDVADVADAIDAQQGDHAEDSTPADALAAEVAEMAEMAGPSAESTSEPVSEPEADRGSASASDGA
jgi:segregation and condensation protein B